MSCKQMLSKHTLAQIHNTQASQREEKREINPDYKREQVKMKHQSEGDNLFFISFTGNLSSSFDLFLMSSSPLPCLSLCRVAQLCFATRGNKREEQTHQCDAAVYFCVFLLCVACSVSWVT